MAHSPQREAGPTMPSRPGERIAAQLRLAVRRAGSLAVVGFIAAALIPAHSEAAGPPHLKGKWTTPNPARWDSFTTTGTLISGGSTHMVLLRGRADSTWILHWHDFEYGYGPDQTTARLSLITPMSDSLYGSALPGIWPCPPHLRCFKTSPTRSGRRRAFDSSCRSRCG